MTVLSFSRRLISSFSSYPRILGSLGFSSEAFRHLQTNELTTSSSCVDSSKFNNCDTIDFHESISSNKGQMKYFNIELVDSNLWPASFILADNCNGMATMQGDTLNLDEDACEDELFDGVSMVEDSLDFDEIENLRIQNKLVYKVDRGSKEYDEYKVDFHRKKTPKKRLEKQSNTKTVKGCKKFEKSSAKPLPRDTMNAKVNHKGPPSKAKPLPRDTMNVKVNHKGPPSKAVVCEMRNEIISMKDKRTRTLTFNQLTDPYHLPFCLDIFVTKGSIRASVIHRVTSRVVAVAHSISKDMKFDLTYKKDATACAAVGEILAKRAIEDDIHNIVYTPRKGDKIEGKLQIVLQSIIDHGIDVKVKLKQKKHVKVLFSGRESW